MDSPVSKSFKQASADFQTFLGRFPEATLPLSLTEEHQADFSRNNEPLTLQEIQDFILPQEPSHDEYTEYVPCLRYPGTRGFYAVIYWKGALLRHEYVLATFDEQGGKIDRKVLSGLRSADGRIIQSVATLEEDWMIHIVEGEGKDDPHSYEALDSRLIQMELLADGRIMLP